MSFGTAAGSIFFKAAATPSGIPATPKDVVRVAASLRKVLRSIMCPPVQVTGTEFY
jgi:hypothetical protein